MRIGQRLRLELDDGRVIETYYDLRDVTAWETKHRKSAMSEDTTYSQLSWLGHHAAVRRGELNGDMTTYEAFAKACCSIEGLKDKDKEPEPDPDADPSPPQSKASRKKAGVASSAG